MHTRSTLCDPRGYTERPETIEVGANTLSGVEPDSIMRSTEKMLNAPATWNNPFGDGVAAMKIVHILQRIK